MSSMLALGLTLQALRNDLGPFVVLQFETAPDVIEDRHVRAARLLFLVAAAAAP
jgi:hypothetical protein